MRPNTDLLPALVHFGWKPLARLRPRTAREIGSSPWSIGLETIDRAYVDFAPLVPHLAALGATQARVQAGWARCEPVKGDAYQWAWLDEIVDGCLAHGIRPWLQTSYGNPSYPGGGGIGLGDGLPVSPEALTAWDRWVRAMADRYNGKVDTWEIWNEPMLPVVSVEDYTRFFIRTATLLREVQPAARILGPGLAEHDEYDFTGKFLQTLALENQTRLLDELTYHFYPHNPDEQFDCVDDLARLCARHAPHVTLRQGETGAPSECSRFLALGKHDWSERKQAAWNLRRLLAHHARGIPMNLFQLADMHYVKTNGARFLGRNPKGLLCMFPDKTVAYPKPSYFAAQHVFTVFDDTFPLTRCESLTGRFLRRTSAHAWQRRNATRPSLLCWWRADAPPSLTTPDLERTGMIPHPLHDPVLIDFMSGHVFAPPPGIATGDETAWLTLPWAETPLALAEKNELPLQPLT
ncbi:hypothetical protein Ga0100231_007545 [Opitutaceae bacterium TAV4]|nr:hypothetical protein Ga0100231_007545 [Opitutaceae bacterium TAV4]RRJ98329.1 hypothetical protein Ga0100230_007820 [Opitutaceae bacterium TAV3]